MECILCERNDQVATIRLNRPEKLNSFNRQMASELLEQLHGLSSDSKVRAIVLTANGRAFCAGQDLKEVLPDKDGNLPSLNEIVLSCYNPIIKIIREIGKPVVCAVNGVAAGAGANLALACDIVLASPHARFIQSFSNIGLIPDSGGTFFLPRLVGVARASAMTFLAEEITAEEAERLGLIYKVYGHDSLNAQALALALQLAKKPTKAFAYTKHALNKSFSNSLEQQLALEADLQGKAGSSEDYKEGVMAFVQKRQPNFTGN